jgi:YfiH family protein
VTDRRGGVSVAPYAELDLGDHVGDDPAAVAENRARLATALGASQLAFMRQVHGRDVAVVDRLPGADAAVPQADALVTAVPGVALVVLVADCVPVLVADGRAGTAGVAHAGRQGVAAGVVGALVGALADLGSDPQDLVALVGPAICGRCYEVPEQMRNQVTALVPAAHAVTRSGTPALDLPAAVAAQLRDAGVRQVERAAVCTAESPDLYSHRRDGVTGRFAGAVLVDA